MGAINFILLGIAAYVIALLAGYHQIQEGYVGIYKKLGVLQPTLSEPGPHFRIPFYEEFI